MADDLDNLVRLKGVTIDLDTDDCIAWPLAVNNRGYGLKYERRPGVGKRAYLAHRWMYELRVGPIPDGCVIDHLCRIKACVNPKHLEAVSLAENNARAAQVARANSESRSTCVNGHIAEWVRIGADEHLRCASCLRDRDRRYKARKQLVGAHEAS